MIIIIYEIIAAVVLILVSAFLIFHIFSRQKRDAGKPSVKETAAPAFTPSPLPSPETNKFQRLRREDFLNDIKNRLEIQIKADEEHAHFNLISGSHMIEIIIGLSLKNNSAHDIVIHKIAWDLWIAGHHIKEGVISNRTLVEPNSTKDGVSLQEILLESQTADLSLASQSKMSSYLEGIIYAETKYGLFNKKFTLLNLNLTFSSETREKLQDFMNASVLDGLTGLLQRKFLDENLQNMINKNLNHHPISFAMLDIDDFKKINDQHGHLTGDEVLKSICDQIREAIRNKGLGVRYGGDEFALILPDCHINTAQSLLEEIRAKVEKLEFKTPEGNIGVTISGGVSSLTEKVNFKILMKHADDMLRYSKQNGKNRVSVDSRKITADWDI